MGVPDLVGACRKIGDAKLAVGARGRTRRGSPERAAVTHLAFVDRHADAVELIGRRKIHATDDERFGDECDSNVVGDGVLSLVRPDVFGFEKAGFGAINWTDPL